MADFRSDDAINAATRTNTTLTKPSGLAVDDILVVALDVENDVAVTPPSTAWEGINISNATQAIDLWVFWKRADSGDTGASNFTFTHSSTWTEGWIGAFSGASTTIDPWFGVSNSGTSTTPLARSVTPIGNDAHIIFIENTFDTTTNFDAPTGSTPTFTERQDAAANLAVYSGTLATAGATGDKTDTITSSSWCCIMMVIEDDAVTSGTLRPYPVQAGDLFASASGTTIVPVIPPLAETNDIMVMAAMKNGSSTFSTPTDWTVLGTKIESDANQSTAWFWKRHDGSESNPSTTVATNSSTDGGYGRIYLFRDCDTAADPFEDTGNAGSPTNSTTPQTSAIDPSAVPKLAVSIVSVDDDNTWSSGMPPTNWTNIGERVSSTTGGDCMMDAIGQMLYSTGSVAAATIGTQSASDYWRSLTFLLTGATVGASGVTVDGAIGAPIMQGQAGVAALTALAVNGAISASVFQGVAGTVSLAALEIVGAIGQGIIQGQAGTVSLTGLTVNGAIGAPVLQGVTGTPELAQMVINGAIGVPVVTGVAGTIALAQLLVNGSISASIMQGVAGTPELGGTPVEVLGAISAQQLVGNPGLAELAQLVVNGAISTPVVQGNPGTAVLAQLAISGATGIMVETGVPGDVSLGQLVVNGAIGQEILQGVAGTAELTPTIVQGAIATPEFKGVAGEIQAPVVIDGAIGIGVLAGVAGAIIITVDEFVSDIYYRRKKLV